jgi:hypothetical protein
MERWGKTNCSNSAIPNRVGIACQRWVSATGFSKKMGLTRLIGVGRNLRIRAVFNQIQPPSETGNQL